MTSSRHVKQGTRPPTPRSTASCVLRLPVQAPGASRRTRSPWQPTVTVTQGISHPLLVRAGVRAGTHNNKTHGAQSSPDGCSAGPARSAASTTAAGEGSPPRHLVQCRRAFPHIAPGCRGRRSASQGSTCDDDDDDDDDDAGRTAVGALAIANKHRQHLGVGGRL